MLVGLHVATNSKCTDKTLKNHYWGGGELPPALPPATLMAGNAMEADIWFGRESAREARGKIWMI